MELPEPIEMLQVAVATLFGALFLVVGAMVYAYHKIKQFKDYSEHAKNCADATYRINEHTKLQLKQFKKDVWNALANDTKNMARLTFAMTETAKEVGRLKDIVGTDLAEPDELEEPDELDDPYQVLVISKHGEVLSVYDIEDLMQLPVGAAEPELDEHEQVELSQKGGSTSTVALAAGVLNGNKD